MLRAVPCIFDNCFNSEGQIADVALYIGMRILVRCIPSIVARMYALSKITRYLKILQEMTFLLGTSLFIIKV